MSNIWRDFATQSTAELFVLLGAEPKYIKGEASDFECFVRLCECCPLLEGNIEGERFAACISRAVGQNISLSEISRKQAAMLWNECNENICDIYYESDEKYKANDFDVDKKICVEKENLLSKAINLNSVLKGCLCRGENSFEKMSKSVGNIDNNVFFVNFEHSKFLRPNAFAAAEEFDKLYRGEKCNANLILCQLVLEKIYNKKCEKLQLIFGINDNAEYINELVKYINFRALGARIFLLCDGSVPPEDIKKLCMESTAKCFISPMLQTEKLPPEYIDELAKIYPICMADILEC